jgi:ferredoxin
MKKQWGKPRSREDVESQIPVSYLAKDQETQERRKLTFLLQESAFSEHIPIFCIIDIDLLPPEEQMLFDGYGITPHAAIIIGQTIAEPFLFAEQSAPGNRGDRISSCAELITLGYLMGFREKIETQGFQTALIPPSPLPDGKLAKMMATSRKGVIGKSQRFLAGEYGAWNSIGLLLTDAPLMGGDYRYPDVTIDLCENCRACIEACPCGAITNDGYDAQCCREYRDNPENQERASTHTVMKCMRCMTACDKKRIKERLA